MPANVSREDVERLLRDGALLIDALPENAYAEEHIEGAINLPIGKLDRQSVASFDRERPVIVYCWDSD